MPFDSFITPVAAGIGWGNFKVVVMIELMCPRCTSFRVRLSAPRGTERIFKYFLRPYRCLDCDQRFLAANRKGFFRFLAGGTLALALVIRLFAFTTPISAGEVYLPAECRIIDTGVFAQAGDTLTFQATGSWTVNPVRDEAYGPDGSSAKAEEGYFIPGDRIGALVGEVAGQRFTIGSRSVRTFERPGRLYITANEKRHAYGDNQGGVSLEVEITPGPRSIIGMYRTSYDRTGVTFTAEKKVEELTFAELEERSLTLFNDEEVPVGRFAEELTFLPSQIAVDASRLSIYLKDAETPDSPALKGVFFPETRQFSITTDQDLESLETCSLFCAKMIEGRGTIYRGKCVLRGKITVVVTINCPQGPVRLTMTIPFSGNKI